jgi:large subunit ribosomal protein L9
MKLILKKAMPNLGEAGEVVEVKAGYGRNYLIPQGIAYVASDANIKRIEEEQAKAEERARRDFLEARRRAAQLEGLVVTLRERAGDDGKLFGSVTAADIAAEVEKTADLDFELDKKTVQLDEALKSLGSSSVVVRLHADVEVDIEVQIEREED